MVDKYDEAEDIAELDDDNSVLLMWVSRDYIYTLLNEGVAEVKFVKKDGTERIMLCTTNTSLIPERAFKPEESVARIEAANAQEVKPKNPDVAVIWDLQKDAWRSFRYDSVTSALSHPAAERY
jgi:hypothetical protein